MSLISVGTPTHKLSRSNTAASISSSVGKLMRSPTSSSLVSRQNSTGRNSTDVPRDSTSVTSNFSENDFRLPELEFNSGVDLDALNAKKVKLRRMNTLKSQIFEESQLLNALDFIEENPDSHLTEIQKSVSESKFKRRVRKVNHQSKMELRVLKHVIARQAGEMKDELKTHQKHLAREKREQARRDRIDEDDEYAVEENVQEDLEDGEEEEEEEVEESTLDHPKIGSLQEKLEDLRQEQIEHWCKKHNKKSGAKYSNHDKRMLRHWFQELDYDGSGEVNVEELQDPMLSAGILKTREQVVRVLANVDKNNTMGIDFEEFLQALTGNKIADQSKLQRLQQMSNNEYGFSMDTLITAERRNKLLTSVLRQCEQRQNEIDKYYRKYEKSKITRRERDQIAKEIEALEEAQAKAIHLHLKYIAALDNVIIDKKEFYIEQQNERQRQFEERLHKEEGADELMKLLIRERYTQPMFATIQKKTGNLRRMGSLGEGSVTSLSSDSNSSTLTNRLGTIMPKNDKASSHLPNIYSLYAPVTKK